MKKDLGIYIHIPFCERKCNYCSFLSFPFSEQMADEYVEELVLEIEKTGKKYNENYLVDTIFIGGGTPSLLSEKHIERLVQSLDKNYTLKKDIEITIESNPNSLTINKLNCYIKNGINRLSIGIQSFDNKLLQTLGRVHNREDALRGYQLAQEAGFENINIDLMFGIPGQSLSQWIDTLEMGIHLNPKHISFYNLQIEENTPFYRDYKNETLEFIVDEKTDEMYIKTLEILKQNDYDHYEISNSGKNGYRCKHNIKYWTMGEYIGIGSGATSYIDGVERKNEKTLSKWKSTIHKRTPEDEMSIFVFTGLRMINGVDLNKFKEKFGISFYEKYIDKIDFLKEEEKRGNLSFADNTISLTSKGILISNDLMCEFV